MYWVLILSDPHFESKVNHCHVQAVTSNFMISVLAFSDSMTCSNEFHFLNFSRVWQSLEIPCSCEHCGRIWCLIVWQTHWGKINLHFAFATFIIVNFISKVCNALSGFNKNNFNHVHTLLMVLSCLWAPNHAWHNGKVLKVICPLPSHSTAAICEDKHKQIKLSVSKTLIQFRVISYVQRSRYDRSVPHNRRMGSSRNTRRECVAWLANDDCDTLRSRRSLLTLVVGASVWKLREREESRNEKEERTLSSRVFVLMRD